MTDPIRRPEAPSAIPGSPGPMADTDPAFMRESDPDLGRGHLSFKTKRMQNSLMAADTFLTRGLAAKFIAGPRNQVQARVQADLAKRPEGVVVDVPRRRNLGPKEFYREHLRKGVPVVMEGMASHWDCCKEWTMQYVVDKYGDDEILVTSGEIQTSDGSIKSAITLRDGIENRDPIKEKYLRFHPLIAEHPELVFDAAHVSQGELERALATPCQGGRQGRGDEVLSPSPGLLQPGLGNGLRGLRALAHKRPHPWGPAARARWPLLTWAASAPEA